MPQVKGSILASRLLWVSLKRGEQGRGQLAEAVLPASREVIDVQIAKSRWYPFDAFCDVNRAIDRLFGTGDLTLVRELGRFGADANLRTIYRLFYMVGSVKFILDRAARLWSLHYDSGKCQVARMPGSEATLRIVDFATPDRTHCLSVAGWAERSIELSGGRDARVEETSCRVNGEAECAFHLIWR